MVRSGLAIAIAAVVGSFAMVVPGSALATDAAPGFAVAHKPGAVQVQPAGWGTPTQIEPSGSDPRAISCWAAKGCAALDIAGQVVFERAGTWGVPSAIGSGGSRQWFDISCTSGEFCVAISDRTYSVFDGSSWGAVQPLNGLEAAESVSCVSPTYCVAVGVDSTSARFDGTRWSTLGSIPGASTDLFSVSCWAAGWCLAGNDHSYALALVDGVWQRRVPLDTGRGVREVDVSCAVGFCIAMQGPAWRSFDGSTWSGIQAIALTGVKQVTCQTAHACLATNIIGDAESFDGTSWTPVARGGPGVIDQAGATPSSVTTILRTGAARTFDGTVWSHAVVVDPQHESLTGVSCTGTTFCLAIDDGGNVLTWDGSGWSGVQKVDPTYLVGVSCASPTFCVVIGGNEGESYVFDGSTWQRRVVSVGADLLTVSCPAVGWCMATDIRGTIYGFSDGSWVKVGRVWQDASVSCPSRGFCMAIAVGSYATWDGTTWSRIETGPFALWASVSCPSANSCQAVDGDGNAYSWDGSTWTSVGDIADFEPLDISCPSAVFCVAVGGGARATTFDGTAWSSAESIEAGSPNLTGISCVDRNLCMLVDDAGNALQAHRPH